MFSLSIASIALDNDNRNLLQYFFISDWHSIKNRYYKDKLNENGKILMSKLCLFCLKLYFHLTAICFQNQLQKE